MSTTETVRADEWFAESPILEEFIAQVNAIRHRASDPHAAVAEIRPHFARLLGDATWLPEKYHEVAEESGMGPRVGMWLLYRAGDGGLAFSVLVLPAGGQTPVHDHLAWGLVGLYRGRQAEEVYHRSDDDSSKGYAQLQLAEQNILEPGDFYELMPANDIHRVRTISDCTSVSLHLLGNDNGCIWRHKFDPDADTVEPFRSGWLNVGCMESAQLSESAHQQAS